MMRNEKEITNDCFPLFFAEEEDSPVIRGFSDDEPLVIA